MGTGDTAPVLTYEGTSYLKGSFPVLVYQAVAIHNTAEVYLATRADYRAADIERRPALLGCLQEAERNLIAAAHDADVSTIVVGRSRLRCPQKNDDMLQLFGRTVIRICDDGNIELFPIDVVVILDTDKENSENPTTSS